MNATADVFARPITLIIALAIATLLPFAFMTLTSFVKISTVLQIVRGAIGAQNVPSSTVILAFAGALTILAMAPLGSRLNERVTPLLAQAQQADSAEWLLGVTAAAKEPIQSFLRLNASERERRRFYEIARAARPSAERDRVQPDDLSVIVPAFVASELLAAFALGFAIYLPFLVLDMVVANVLLALGMQMLNPTQVSLPFKLLLFVAIDGWGLLAQTLVTGYKF
ncbi:MAG TPA: EscR/YscR/HrcR family type III secretion system export apparatus protein [Polyangiaceae bacterium]